MKINQFFAGASLLSAPGFLAAQPAMLWSETYGGSDYEYRNSVVQTDDGDFVIAG